MPIDTKCPVCDTVNEVYGNDLIRGDHTVKRCSMCGAFLDPDYVKKSLANDTIRKFLWIMDGIYQGSGIMANLVVSGIDKDKKLYMVQTRIEKIELLKETGQTEKIIFQDKGIDEKDG